MLTQTSVNGIRTWTSPNGELQVLRPVPHVLVTRFRGAMYDVHFAQVTQDAIEEHAAMQRMPDIFHDWEGMQLYETESRIRLTKQAMRLLPRIGSFSVLAKSKVVRMGVSMASLMLGGRIQLYTERNEFEQAIQRTVASRAQALAALHAAG
jgi:hypothetical protein